MSKKILFALVSQCLVAYLENLAQTKNLIKNLKLFAFLKKIIKILILIKFKKLKFLKISLIT